MDISNNIVAKMNTWHAAATKGQITNAQRSETPNGESLKFKGEPTYETILDTFNAHFEELSSLDQSPYDKDKTGGGVRLDIPRGNFFRGSKAVDKSLRKTDDGFEIRVRESNRDLVARTSYAGNWFENFDTRFSLNEKTNVLTVKEFATDASNTWNPSWQTNTFHLDLNAHTLITPESTLRASQIRPGLEPSPRPSPAGTTGVSRSQLSPADTGPRMPSPGPGQVAYSGDPTKPLLQL
jgi:hypothetical protein